jgi:uncharacterized OB-fold protein
MFEKRTDPREVLLFPGRMPVSHRYTAGLAGERFFRALKDRGVFLATRCSACSVTYCPARAFCERCLAALEDDVEAGPGGSLESFTVVHVGLDGERLDPPAVIGLVRLDGADTLLVHRVEASAGGNLVRSRDGNLGSWRAGLHIGMRVQAVFEEPARRRGHLDDVRFFEPVP